MNASKADLKGIVQQWADHIGVRMPEIHLRHMRRKWASISMKGRLTLNTELLDLPEALREYVIVHELVHLLVPNHGKLFKGYMSAYLPDWEERQNRLRSFY
ncbi:M48 family metallopeptidase [Candidatus Poribacteria bacterium]|nr:M48 family metallopeptidase [Candidatus Poribacteria bacterium]MYA99871.1 M48 family metallopeptidase [Candidatus Poribacteria bacterium]